MTVAGIAELLGVVGLEEAREVSRVAAPADATAEAIVFAEDGRALEAALGSAAGLILTTPALAAGCGDSRVMAVAAPKYAFAVCAKALAAKPVGEIHASAVVEASARLGARVRVGPGAVVEAGAVLGDDVCLGANVTVCHGVQVGSRVVVQAGAVLGSTGFGFVRDGATGEYLLFPQQGALVIEDDVEIGANTTIDRGALGETRIGAGTKIDNLVHIGHNCRVGRNVVIAAQVGISGSCVIEDGAILAGQVGISDHCHVGPGVILGGQAGVFRGATVTGPGELFAGTPAEPIKNFLKSLARLRRLK